MGSARPADRPGCSVPALARISKGRASGSPGTGHIQQLQRPGSVERDQTGQRRPGTRPARRRGRLGAGRAGAGRVARGGAGGRAGCWRGRRDRGPQASTRPKATGPAGPADRPVWPARNSTSSPTWAAGCWWWPALAGMHEVVLVAGLGVGVVAGSTAAGEHRDEGHGIRQASRSTVLQRADAGQELDQLADVAGLGAGGVGAGRVARGCAGGPAGCWRGRRIDGRRWAPGRGPRDQTGQPIDCAAACRRWPGSRRAGPRGRPVPGTSSSCGGRAAWSGTRPARNSPGTPTWAAGCWSCRRWPGGTRWCWWPGWVSAWSPGSRAAGEHQAEGHGTSRASRSTGLAGQELDQRADVGGWVLAVACAGRDARGGAGGRAGCWRGRRIDGRRRAPGRRPRDQAGQPIDHAAACRHWPGCNPPEEGCRPGSRPAPTWPGWVSAWSQDRRPQASTRKKAMGSARPADRPGCSVPALAGMHEVVLVAGLGVGVVAGSTAAGEHRDEGHGIRQASRSTVLQRADAGQELDQLADVAGLGAGGVGAGRVARGCAGGPAGCWRGRRIDGRRRAPGRRPRDQPGQPIDRAAACRRWPGCRRAGPRGCPVPGTSSSCSGRAAWSGGRPASRPAPARNSPGTPTWAAGCWSCRRWPVGTRRCWWSGWVSARSPDRRPKVSTKKKATGSGRPADRPGCSVPALDRISTGRASGSPGAGHIQQLQRLGSVERDQTGQRASAGQELDQGADVGGGVLVVAGAGRDARGGAGGRAGCWRGRRIDGRRRAPGRRPRDQAGQPIDRAAAC